MPVTTHTFGVVSSPLSSCSISCQQSVRGLRNITCQSGRNMPHNQSKNALTRPASFQSRTQPFWQIEVRICSASWRSFQLALPFPLSTFALSALLPQPLRRFQTHCDSSRPPVIFPMSSRYLNFRLQSQPSLPLFLFQNALILMFSPSVTMSSSPRLRFDGRIYVQQFDLAVRFAKKSCAQQPTAQQRYFNLFCDASKDLNNVVRGGISVTYPPWGPHQDSAGEVVAAAWPVNPVYDHRLGELLALAECLVVATSQIADFDDCMWLQGVRPTIVVRIFNDNMYNLEYLGGIRWLDDGLLELA